MIPIPFRKTDFDFNKQVNMPIGIPNIKAVTKDNKIFL